ncbi:hypothetical protein Q3G72_002377 [Acer saccharum]|nr:hypothetical protein Q3G72_002377 [Acer saccharum]
MPWVTLMTVTMKKRQRQGNKALVRQHQKQSHKRKRFFGEGSEDGGPGLEEEEHIDAIFKVLAYLYSFCVSDYVPYLRRVVDLDGHEKVMKENIGIIDRYHDPIIEERILELRDHHGLIKKKVDHEDLLDVFITLKDEDGNPLLSTEEIKAQITESQFKSRGYFANVPSTNSSSSARVVEYGKKVSIIQRSSSDIPEREVVPFETRQGRKVNTGLTNLSHIKGHPEKSSVGVLCQGRKEKGKKVWLRRPKKDDFWGREGERILKGNCSKTGHIGSQVNSGPIQTEQGNGPVQTVQKKVGSNLSSGSKSSQSRMDRSCYEISKEGQLWVEIGPNQKSTAFKSSILEKPPLEEVEQSTNEEQSLRSKETAEDSPKQTWNLEVEITKVIEQGVAIGYNFNRRAREEESESEGEEEDLNMEEGEVQATVVTKSKGRKKTQAVKKHGMQTRNSAIRQSQDQANSLNLTQQKRRPKLSWNLEDEIAKGFFELEGLPSRARVVALSELSGLGCEFPGSLLQCLSAGGLASALVPVVLCSGCFCSGLVAFLFVFVFLWLQKFQEHLELMVATVDNPSNAVEWALAEMINQPKILGKAIEELDRVVGKERSDTTVANYFIPKGSHVLLSRSGLGRNPKAWPDETLKFKPERHLKDDDGSEVVLTENDLRFISFSTGRRGCIGVTLGTSMTVMLFARLLQGFTWTAPPNESKIDLSEAEDSLALAKPLIAVAKPRLAKHVYPAET